MRTAVETMELVSHAWERGECDTIRALLHPDGRWAFVTTETRTFRDPDLFVNAIRHAHEQTSYKLFTVSHEQLTESVLLARAYVRTPTHTGNGHDVGRHFFLVEVRAGLFYRSEHFRNDAEARAAFESRAWESGTPAVPFASSWS